MWLRCSLSAVLFWSVLVGGSTAKAQADPAAAPSQDRPAITMARGSLPAQELEHLDVLNGAERDFAQKGFAALSDHREAIAKVLSEAPDTYDAIVQQDDVWIVRGSLEQAAYVLPMADVYVSATGRPLTLQVVPNIYPKAALYLGSEAIERRAYREAIGFLDRGLALQPRNGALIGEKAVALGALGEQVEALALLDAALATNDLGMVGDLARLNRQRGFLLVELGDLQGAREAYETSLRYEPTNRLALHQLTYIESLEIGGGEGRPSVLRSKDFQGDEPAGEVQ
jgi:tetratricopeptide (TPR) repeat protein